MSASRNHDTQDSTDAASSSRHGSTTAAAAVRQSETSGKRAKVHQLTLLRDLRASIDVLYTVQIAIGYYLDNSFIVLSLRLFSQSLLARAESQSTIDPVHTYFAVTFVPGILCFLLHLLLAISTPSEATRWYHHGSLLLDFVGQSGPVPRSELILQDVLLFVLQLLYLDVCQRRRALSARLKSRRPATQSSSAGSAPPVPPTIQDLDREERATEQQDQEDASSDSLASTDPSMTLLDDLYSGQSDLGTFWMLKLIKDKQSMHMQGLQDSTSTLSSVIQSDIRRRGYALNIPFRS